MNDNKKILITICISIIASLAIFFTGFGFGFYRCNKRISSGSGDDLQRKNRELIERTTDLERELEKRITEIGEYQRLVGDISTDINESIELSKQTGSIAEAIEGTISNINNASSDIAETIELIINNQQRIRECVTELQNQNNEIGKRLEGIQDRINE